MNLELGIRNLECVIVIGMHDNPDANSKFQMPNS
jgi:hypothetical protein